MYPRAWFFESSGEAYDATQCQEAIRTGDIIIVLSEGVIGIADTWPFAVTKETGNLHLPLVQDSAHATYVERKRLNKAIEQAAELAVSLGYEIVDGIYKET